MLIYKDTTLNFVNTIRENKLTDLIVDSFTNYLGRNPGHSEVVSWQNSLPRVRDLIELASLNDNMIAIEYEVPYNQSRVDCLLFGKGKNEEENVVLIELKQWTNVTALGRRLPERDKRFGVSMIHMYVGGQYPISIPDRIWRTNGG